MILNQTTQSQLLVFLSTCNVFHQITITFHSNFLECLLYWSKQLRRSSLPLRIHNFIYQITITVYNLSKSNY